MAEAPALGAALRRALLMLLATLVVVGLGLVLLGRTEVGAEPLQRLVLAARPGPLLLGLGLMSLNMPATALRWRALLPVEGRKAAGPVFLTGLLCTGFALSLALPGPAGDVLGAAALRRRSGIPFSEGIGALVVGRVLGLGTAALLAGIAGLSMPGEVPAEWALLLRVAAGMLLVGALFLATAVAFPTLPRRLTEAALSPLTRLGPARLRQRAEALRRGAAGFAEGLARATRQGPMPLVLASGWTLMGHLCMALGVAAVASGIGLELSVSSVVFTYAATVAGSVALFLLPGSHLGWDVAFASLLSFTGGLPLVDAVAVTGMMRMHQTLVVIVGVAALWLLFRDLLPGRVALVPEEPTEAEAARLHPTDIS